MLLLDEGADKMSDRVGVEAGAAKELVNVLLRQVALGNIAQQLIGSDQGLDLALCCPATPGICWCHRLLLCWCCMAV